MIWGENPPFKETSSEKVIGSLGIINPQPHLRPCLRDSLTFHHHLGATSSCFRSRANLPRYHVQHLPKREIHLRLVPESLAHFSNLTHVFKGCLTPNMASCNSWTFCQDVPIQNKGIFQLAMWVEPRV